MLPVVVTVRMPVPPTPPRLAIAILLRVLHVEIVRLEPANAKRRALHTCWKIPRVKFCDDGIWRIRRPILDTVELLSVAGRDSVASKSA